MRIGAKTVFWRLGNKDSVINLGNEDFIRHLAIQEWPYWISVIMSLVLFSFFPRSGFWSREINS